MRYFALSFALLFTVTFSDAQQGSFQNDFKLLRSNIANYLLNTSNIALNFAPAGIDGKSGCINEKMNNKTMDRLADPMDEFPFYSQLGEQFYESFFSFSLENQKAFRQCGSHIGTDMHQQHILYDCGQCNINHLVDVSYHILRLNLDKPTAEPLLVKVRENILKMYEQVNHGNDLAKDCRANGWITYQVHNAARAGLDHLNAINVNNRESTAGKLGLVMSHFYKELLALPLQDYDCWLSPEWQVGYFTIMYSTYLELNAMGADKSSTAYLDYVSGKK